MKHRISSTTSTSDIAYALETQQRELEMLINATPTGPRRETLTEANIMTMIAIRKLREKKNASDAEKCAIRMMEEVAPPDMHDPHSFPDSALCVNCSRTWGEHFVTRCPTRNASHFAIAASSGSQANAPILGYRVDASYFQKLESVPKALRFKAIALVAQHAVDTHESAQIEAGVPDRAADLDKLLTQVLNRRVTIEQRMFNAAGGKRPMPTPDELRQWAIELGTEGAK